MLERRAHHAGSALRTQGQRVAIHGIDKGIHFLFDDIGHGAETARKQRSRLDDRRANLLKAVTFQYRLGSIFEQLPQWGIGRENVLHSLHANNFFCFFIFGHFFRLLLCFLTGSR